ncbi:hypothetical protein [Phaeobacter italicus]|mgnify:CR=1 FL=1|jgi:hypothetical protein|uniref:Uncharacterized protein n=1 Tax=Phaeobacter italicus TaxID=481446 RepID=A0A0H5DLC5_9RHOB|nr:hypothetical protein [Phaeobacter italicus]EEB71345.1 hypothetical protein RR11_2105 [Ruegeria sp. R11]MEC8572782.1 hypothetical protein [Pseudomonadota bacterium]MBO9443449.1 hypothetical protein [Phaeobacter italicus]MBY5977873.1 hypothetical protein [Phaeobacter italicus]MBY6045223.1 hypothetical protein [Phaeobacter italicus]
MPSEWVVSAIFISLWIVAFQWRRWRLRLEASELPEAARDRLGPAPYFTPPPRDRLTPELVQFARFHRKSRLPGLILLFLYLTVFVLSFQTGQ